MLILHVISIRGRNHKVLVRPQGTPAVRLCTTRPSRQENRNSSENWRRLQEMFPSSQMAARLSALRTGRTLLP
jgi:hypothetical protein